MPITVKRDGVVVEVQDGKKENYYVCANCCHELQTDYHDHWVHNVGKERRSCDCNCQRFPYSPLIFKDITREEYYVIMSRLHAMSVSERCALVQGVRTFNDAALKGVIPS